MKISGNETATVKEGLFFQKHGWVLVSQSLVRSNEIRIVRRIQNLKEREEEGGGGGAGGGRGGRAG